jgi:hypothetical protein
MSNVIMDLRVMGFEDRTNLNLKIYPKMVVAQDHVNGKQYLSLGLY